MAHASPDLVIKPFPELTVHELYEVLKLRIDVFVLEQRCLYPEIDGKDPEAVHVLARQGKELVAYGRWYPSGDRVVLGRIATAARGRGRGWGKAVVAGALRAIGPKDVEVNAQTYLEEFYRNFGFIPQGEPVVEDGIPHIRMLRQKNHPLNPVS